MKDEWRKECEGLYDEWMMNEGCWILTEYGMKKWILTSYWITVKEGMMNVGMRVRKMLKEGMNTYQEGMMNEGRNDYLPNNEWL